MGEVVAAKARASWQSRSIVMALPWRAAENKRYAEENTHAPEMKRPGEIKRLSSSCASTSVRARARGRKRPHVGGKIGLHSAQLTMREESVRR